MTDHRPLQRLTILLTALAVSLAICAPANAALQAEEEAFELNVSQIQRWPLREGDSLVVKPCRGCEILALRVTADTEYATAFDDDVDRDLPEILRIKSGIRINTAHVILVFYRPDNHQVTRLIVMTDL